MPKFVPDIKTRRWLVIAPKRFFRPKEKKPEDQKEIFLKDGFFYKKDCPFCPGNEKMTPPEIYRFPKEGNWQVRVFPNKFPITNIHEIVVHSPDHKKDIDQLPKGEVEVLFRIFRERFRVLSQEGQVLIYNNKGPLAGPSLAHPHSQIVVIPKQIKLDVLSLEPVKNVVFETQSFVSYCPEFSQWPYEVWIAKKECFKSGHQEGCLFGGISGSDIRELVGVVKTILRRLYLLFPHLSYNFYLSPIGCWYLRIIPRLTQRAGFELGTGLHVNVVEPEKAAKRLRRVNNF